MLPSSVRECTWVYETAYFHLYRTHDVKLSKRLHGPGRTIDASVSSYVIIISEIITDNVPKVCNLY